MDQGGELNPLCFGLVGVAVDGEASIDSDGLGCATAPTAGGLALVVGLSGIRRRRW